MKNGSYHDSNAGHSPSAGDNCCRNSFHDANRNKLIALFKKSCRQSQKLGLELEHILLHRNTHTPVSYSEPGGVRDILERLSGYYRERFCEGEDLIGLAGENGTITIEPAGQLELSIKPCASITEIEEAYLEFRSQLDPILDDFNLETPMLGYHPTARAIDLELIPKFRYECMNEFLGNQSYYGVCMMRGSSSLQISIDFESEQDAINKMRLAQIIAPILALICDNSPFFEGEDRPFNLVRTAIWANMNQDRVGTIPGSLDEGFSFSDYADYILSREAILVPAPGEEAGWRYVGAKTFDEIYVDRAMTDKEIDHALSMVWPDARLKSFVEIRPADAMPFEFCLAYAVLIRALFYNKRNLSVLEALLPNVTEQDVADAKRELMEKSYGATVYGRSVEFWADFLVVLASGCLEPEEQAYFEPLASMVKYRFTLAEVWPRLMEKREHTPAGSPGTPVIGIVPRYDFEWTGLAVSDGYLSGLLEEGAVPIVLPATNDPAHIKRIVAACDGFLIPGGQDIDPSCYGAARKPHTHRSASTRDAMEQALIKAVIEADKPLLGICRGIQALNVALGGTLHQDILDDSDGSALVHIQNRPYDMPAHYVEIAEDSLLASCVGATRLGVNTIHHQAIDKLGEGLVVCAVSPDDGVIEGIELPTARFVIGVQWHPEYMWRLRPHSKRLFKALTDAAIAARDDNSAD